ncbi:MAG: hypothetical protein K6E34_15130 [Lachnospiraceae bacterium]|nr:hypothetical protein [Lachnospiraceae bacterium]
MSVNKYNSTTKKLERLAGGGSVESAYITARSGVKSLTIKAVSQECAVVFDKAMPDAGYAVDFESSVSGAVIGVKQGVKSENGFTFYYYIPDLASDTPVEISWKAYRIVQDYDLTALEEEMDDIRDFFNDLNIDAFAINETLYDNNKDAVLDSGGESILARIKFNRA